MAMAMAMVDNLPVEVLTEILSWLPVKSLLRFKSVSKYWYSLIQDPSFLSLHHNRAHVSDCLLVLRRDELFSMYLLPNETSIEDLDISFTGPRGKHLYLYGSSHGIMCLANESDILICNPAIREFRLLPQPPDYHTWFTSDLWFIFCPKTFDCKVFRLATLYEFVLSHDPHQAFDHVTTATTVDHKIQIYDMSKDSWREMGSMLPKDFLDKSHPCCSSLNGNFYWLGYDSSTNVHMIGILNTSEELFEQMTFPENICSELLKTTRMSYLSVLKDSLALVLSDYGYGKVSFGIWVMDEYGVKESWIKKYSIGPLFGFHFTLGFRQNVDVLLMRGANRLMVSYNLSTGNRTEYNQLCNMPELDFVAEFFPYSESLISVKRPS